LEILADRAGITLPTVENNIDSKKQLLKEKVYEINEIVASIYHENLYKPVAKTAQEYVKKRKLDNKTLKNFQIGYAEGGSSIYQLLRNKGYTDEEILASTLVKKINGGYADVFRNRLMFPIKDVRNRVIAFGGRVLDDSLPKYINSPDTVVYNKGRNLFGLNIAKNSNKQNIIMVEGYMDTISLHQRGIDNVVASLGTALTEAQGRLIRKYSEKIVISYDSDGAGQAATLRGLEILDNLGCDVRILQMEGAKDPDEYIIKYGSGRFELLVENAISLVEFKTKMLKKDLNLDVANDKIKFLKEIAKLLGNIDSRIEQEIYIDKISSEYKISREAIYAEINKLKNKNQSSRILERNTPSLKTKINKEESDTFVKRENAVIAVLLNGNIDIEDFKNKISADDFKSEINKKIIEKLYEEFQKGNSNINSILDSFNQDEQVLSRITEIMSEDYQIKDDLKAVETIINMYKREKLANRKLEIIKMLNSEIGIEEARKLESELQEIIIKLAQIK